MRESGRFVQRAMRADTPWWPRCGNHVSDTGLEGSAEACFLRAATGGSTGEAMLPDAESLAWRS